MISTKSFINIFIYCFSYAPSIHLLSVISQIEYEPDAGYPFLHRKQRDIIKPYVLC